MTKHLQPMQRTKIADRAYIISSKENVHRNVEEIGNLFPLKRLGTAKHRPPSNQTYKLQRLWYVAERETNILQRNLSLGVLQRIPLIKIGKNGPRTMPKGRAFQKCIAT